TAAVGIGTFTKSVVQNAIEVQKSEAALRGMTGSTKQANGAMRGMKAIAKNSSIDYNSYLKAGANLAYLGVKGKETTPILKTMTDAVIGFGGSSEHMDRMTQAMLQMVNEGKASTDALLQMSNAGLPIFDMLTAKTGKTTDELRKLASDGKLSIDTVMAAIKERGGPAMRGLTEAAEEVRKTWSFQWNQMKNNVREALGQGMTPMVDKAAPMLKKFGDSASNSLKNTPATFNKIKSGLEKSGIIGNFKALGQGIKDLVTNAGPFAQGFGAGLVGTFGALTFVLRPVGALLSSIGNWMKNNQTAATALGAVVGGLVAAFVSFKVAMIAFNGVMTVVRAGMMIWKGLMIAIRVATVAWSVA